jgi:predicted deacylase
MKKVKTNVVSMEDVAVKQKQAEKDNLLNTVDEFRKKVENGEIVAFAISSVRSDEDVEITACVKDRLQAIGLIEASKIILFNSGTEGE